MLPIRQKECMLLRTVQWNVWRRDLFWRGILWMRPGTLHFRNSRVVEESRYQLDKGIRWSLANRVVFHFMVREKIKIHSPQCKIGNGESEGDNVLSLSVWPGGFLVFNSLHSHLYNFTMIPLLWFNMSWLQKLTKDRIFGETKHSGRHTSSSSAAIQNRNKQFHLWMCSNDTVYD